MPIFITRGRYTRDAIKGMVARPEDRAEMVARLAEQAGGRMLGYYVTFGEHDFLVIFDIPGANAMASALFAAAAGGGVTDLKTVLAMTTADAKEAFAAAGRIAGAFRSAGAS